MWKRVLNNRGVMWWRKWHWWRRMQKFKTWLYSWVVLWMLWRRWRSLWCLWALAYSWNWDYKQLESSLLKIWHIDETFWHLRWRFDCRCLQNCNELKNGIQLHIIFHWLTNNFHQLHWIWNYARFKMRTFKSDFQLKTVQI